MIRHYDIATGELIAGESIEGTAPAPAPNDENIAAPVEARLATWQENPRPGETARSSMPPDLLGANIESLLNRCNWQRQGS